MVKQLARKTDSREINLPQTMIERILSHFASLPESELESLKKSLLEVSEISENEQDRIFGEHLPSGLGLGTGQ